jgi:hypothetical protein
VRFAWGQEQDAFEALKQATSQPPALRIEDFSEQFILQTDASGVALEAVLSQERDGVTAHCACFQNSECPGAQGLVYIRIGMFGGSFFD